MAAWELIGIVVGKARASAEAEDTGFKEVIDLAWDAGGGLVRELAFSNQRMNLCTLLNARRAIWDIMSN